MIRSRTIHRSIFAVALLSAGIAHGWGNERAHPQITDSSLFRALESVDEVLRQTYGLPSGVATPLGIQREIGSAALQAELETNRFAETLWIAFGPEAPERLRVELNDRCSPGVDFENCYTSLDRYPIDHLLRSGVFGEDNPNVRAAHHFHDPARVHGMPDTALPPGFPADNRGQDNTTVLALGSFDELLANFGASLRGGGDFRRPRADRARMCIARVFRCCLTGRGAGQGI